MGPSCLEKILRLLCEKSHFLYTKYWYVIPYALRSYEEPLRSNPDINHIIYAYFSPHHNNYIHNIAIYHENANNITDSFVKNERSDQVINNKQQSTIYYELIHDYNVKQTEHPNEVMACLIVDIVLNNVDHYPTIEWMKKYFIE